MQKITPFLWFDDKAEEAARFYTSIFKKSKIGNINHYGKEGYEIHRRQAGTVMTVECQIEGKEFIALNRGPQCKSTEAVSFSAEYRTEGEVDERRETLADDGDEGA